MRFDRVAVLDWSASGVPTRGKDSIWLGVTGRSGTTAENHSTRSLAEAALHDLIDDALRQGQRLLLGADFNFGAPAGLAQRLTGKAQALTWWAWLATRTSDTDRNQTNYRHIAAEMNGHWPGDGPFWGNGARVQIPGLPRTKPARPAGLAEHRQTDLAGRTGGLYPKPIWQLAGAGAVGAQSLTGLPVLWRLRQAFEGHCAVWPFEAADRPVVLAEVYASHAGPGVARLQAGGMVRDEAQVRLMSAALYRLGTEDRLGPLFAPGADATTLIDEGWTLGNGHVPAIRQAAGDGATDAP